MVLLRVASATPLCILGDWMEAQQIVTSLLKLLISKLGVIYQSCVTRIPGSLYKSVVQGASLRYYVESFA